MDIFIFFDISVTSVTSLCNTDAYKDDVIHINLCTISQTSDLSRSFFQARISKDTNIVIDKNNVFSLVVMGGG
jgi:hypothetical protein